MTKIKALIFDLGKVVFDVSFDRIFQFWAGHSVKTFSEIKSRFCFDELCERFERDEISESAFRKALSDKLGISFSDELFDEGWCSLYLDIYPETDKLLKQLKKNYRIVALTNTNRIHERVWPEKYKSTLLHFEKVFSSPDMKVRKPEAGAFKLVLDWLQVKPYEAIFLDDNAENIKGAERLGIRSVLVASPGQMRREFNKMLGPAFVDD